MGKKSLFLLILVGGYGRMPGILLEMKHGILELDLIGNMAFYAIGDHSNSQRIFYQASHSAPQMASTFLEGRLTEDLICNRRHKGKEKILFGGILCDLLQKTLCNFPQCAFGKPGKINDLVHPA